VPFQISIVAFARCALVALAILLCGCEVQTLDYGHDTTRDNDRLFQGVRLVPDAGTLNGPSELNSRGRCLGRDVCQPTPRSVPRCSQSWDTLFDLEVLPTPVPGSNDYEEPTEVTRQALFDVMTYTDLGDHEKAATLARRSGYVLCTRDEVFVLYPARAEMGGARVAWRRGEAEPAIFEAPHTFYDIGTHTQALDLFLSLNARAVIISGTHRCASHENSRCDGQAQVCSGDELPFKASDMAHSVNSIFQIMHEYLAMRYDDAWIFSMHGMSDDGVSVSDGTVHPLHKSEAAVRVSQAIAEIFPDEHITSCNEWEGAHVDRRLCGTSNVQGRFVNGSAHPCTEEAPDSSGRFIHLEQSRLVRSQTFKMASAIRLALAR
jgi:hypothetical protein